MISVFVRYSIILCVYFCLFFRMAYLSNMSGMDKVTCQGEVKQILVTTKVTDLVQTEMTGLSHIVLACTEVLYS